MLDLLLVPYVQLLHAPIWEGNASDQILVWLTPYSTGLSSGTYL